MLEHSKSKQPLLNIPFQVGELDEAVIKYQQFRDLREWIAATAERVTKPTARADVLLSSAGSASSVAEPKTKKSTGRIHINPDSLGTSI